MNESRRKYPRIAIDRSVGVLVSGHYRALRALQMSEGGLLIGQAFGFAVEMGQQGVATIRVAPATYASCLFRIAYIRDEQCFAVEFLDLPIEMKRLIRHSVARQISV